MNISRPIFIVFILCFFYWGLLFFTSEMELRHDALGYQKLGQMLYRDGWQEYFRTGPNREPLYPFTVSFSMRIADSLDISYLGVQKVFQIFLLFISQLLVLALLRILKIRESISAGILFYLGFSPALVNAALSLYSEIIAVPLVAAIILGGWNTWQSFKDGNFRKSLACAVVTTIIFIFASLVKAIFQYVYLALFTFCLLVFIARVVFWKVDRRWMLNVAANTVLSAVIFFSFAIGYRLLNKTYNGKFEFSNRYDVLLFGNAGVRVENLDRASFLARIASVPGGGFCRRFFSEEVCLGGEFHHSDAYWPQYLPDLLDGVPADQVARKTIQLTISKIGENPAQYLFLTLMESFKMGFWESTQIGFVKYPPWLMRLFLFGPFKDGIRLGMAMLTYLALGFLIIYCLMRSNPLNRAKGFSEKRVQIGCLLLLVILSYTCFYSLFAVLTRFGIPMASLYLIAIAIFLEEIFSAFMREKIKQEGGISA